MLISASETTPEVLLAGSAYLFICPENLGTMTGMMKEMFDRCYYPLLGRVEGRAYATAIAAGSDGRGAQAQIDRIVTGWRLKRVADSLIANMGAQTPEAILAPKSVDEDVLAACRELGAALGEGLELGIY
jgi:multimeric flavodoxin WrbA